MINWQAFAGLWAHAEFASFAWPWLFLALPLPWLLRRILPARPESAAALRLPYQPKTIAVLQKNAGGARIFWPAALLAILGWLLLCMAAARPQFWGAPIQPPQFGRDLMLALDVSGSMEAGDMQLNGRSVDRMTAAKAVLVDFLQQRQGDRVGLIVFGSRAYVLTPLTHDLTSVGEQLGDTVVGLAGRETAIGDAIGLAVRRLAEQTKAQRTLILLTDGVQTAGELQALRAAEIARDYGVRIHTISFGGQGQTAQLFGFRFQLPAHAAESMDEEVLQQIAEITGGQAFLARDTQQLSQIYAQIQKLEPVEQQGQVVRPRHEGYGLPLLLAWACLLLAVLLRRWLA